MKLATPVSHLFEVSDNATRIITESDCLEGRPQALYSTYPRQELFHCDEIQPIHQLREEEFDYIRKVKELKPDLKLITFHCASRCDGPILGLGGRVWMEIGGQQYTREEMKKNARENIFRIQEILGHDVAIAIENNNYYPTPVYEIITDPDFISEIVHENSIHFLLDMAHVQVSCLNSGKRVEEYLKRLPLDRMIQLHISRFGIHPEVGWAMDDHESPTEETFTIVKDILKAYSPSYLTVEYYKDTDILVSSLKKLRFLVSG